MSNFKIKVLSPVHIGDNDTKRLSSLSDFLFDNNQIRMIDHKKLESIFVEDPQIMEDYIKEVNAYAGRSYSINSFFEKYHINPEEVLSTESIPFYGKFEGKEIQPFISENGKRFIPGSTVKGAIRNALAYEFTKYHPEIIDKINSKFFKPGSNPRFTEDKQIFGKDPFNDVLRYLQVSDSRAFDISSYAVFGCKSYHLKKQNLTMQINYECLTPKSSTEIRININNRIPKNISYNIDEKFWNQYLTIPGILKALNAISIKFIERELEETANINDMKSTKQFYRDMKNKIISNDNKAAYFCIGKGTTIMEKTMLLALQRKDMHKLRNKMKETRAARNFGWKTIYENKQRKLVPSARLPVTRLVYPYGNKWLSGLGWVKMEKI